MLATLGAIIAAQQSDSRDADGNSTSDDAIQAAVIGGQALGHAAADQLHPLQRVRSRPHRHPDPVRAGYSPDGMADFFERMSHATRSNAGGYQMPDYLQTHPVTSTRFSEARDRASRLKREKPSFTATGAVQPSLLLPWGMSAASSHAAAGPERMFDWARERLRVLSAETSRRWRCAKPRR